MPPIPRPIETSLPCEVISTSPPAGLIASTNFIFNEPASTGEAIVVAAVEPCPASTGNEPARHATIAMSPSAATSAANLPPYA
ncbi:MAG: hypothetical protein IPO36_17890 [Anaerolineales bacterium]|nr:hypothetical protein [Anaerolineales bacterium]